MLIDSHAHIYLEEFDGDREDVILRAKKSGIEKIILPNVDNETIERLIDVSDKYPEICFPLMGLHPTTVGKDYKKDIITIEEWLQERKFCGIGEIGIDLYWDKTFKAEQEDAFRIQLQMAKTNNLPIVIHVRNSFEEVYDILKQEQNGELKGIFHCFSGGIGEAQKVIDLGFKLGIGGVVTFKNSNLGDVISQIDVAHLVLETDSPYLAPVPYRGKRNESSYIRIIAEKVASVSGISFEKVAEITSENVIELFHI